MTQERGGVACSVMCTLGTKCVLLTLPYYAWQVGADSGAAAAAWFTQALGVACWLVQQRPGSRAAVGPQGPRSREGLFSGAGSQEGGPGSGAAPGAEAEAAGCANASIGMAQGFSCIQHCSVDCFTNWNAELG